MIIWIAAAAVLIATGLYLYFGLFNVPQKKIEKENEIVEKSRTHQYTFSGKPETRRLYKGDQILIVPKTGKGNIILTVSNTLGNLTLQTPSGSQIIELSEERELDIDGDRQGDIVIYLSDVSSKDGAHGAETRMFLKDPSLVVIDDTEAEQTNVSEIPVQAVVKTTSKQTVILEDTRAYPFTVNVSFRGSCVFRYRVDRQQSVEDYYKSGGIVNVTASNGIRLWMSNINAMKIQIIADTSTYDLEVGRAGQVKVEDIKWVRDNDGKYRLVVVELD